MEKLLQDLLHISELCGKSQYQNIIRLNAPVVRPVSFLNGALAALSVASREGNY